MRLVNMNWTALQNEWESENYPYRESWRIAMLFLASFVILFTILGNSLTLFAVFRMKLLQNSVSNLYIASLAAADLIVGSFVMFFMAFYTIAYENRWTLGPFFCDIWQTVDFVSTTISLYSICAIGFDRWWNLEKPLRIFKRNRKQAKRIIALVWGFPFLIWIPVVLTLRIFNGPPATNKCEFTWNPKFLVPAIAVPFLYIPVIILIILFIRITFVIRSHFGFLHRHSNRGFLNPNSARPSIMGRSGELQTWSQTPAPPGSPKLTPDGPSPITLQCQSTPYLAPPTVKRRKHRRQSSPTPYQTNNGSCSSKKRHSVAQSPLAIRVMRERLETLKETGTRDSSTTNYNPSELNAAPAQPPLMRKVLPCEPQEGTPLLLKVRDLNSLKREDCELCKNFNNNANYQCGEGMSENVIDACPDALSIDSAASKRTSIASDTAVVITKLFELKQQQTDRSRALLRANTEAVLDLTRSSRVVRQSARFSIISIASNLFAGRNESISLFSDFMPTAGLTQQIRAAKAVGLLLIAFLSCWLPFLILWPIKTYCADCVSDGVYSLAIWANYLNSTLNPVLYTLCSPRVQRALQMQFSHCSRKTRRSGRKRRNRSLSIL